MKKLFKLSRIVVSIFLIAFLLYLIRDELHQILITLKNTSILLYSLCFFLNLIAILIVSHRLREIFRLMGVQFTSWNCTVLNLIGLFFNNFLPTSAGGDLLKIYYASQGSGRKVESVTGVLADRFFGLFAIFLLASVAILLEKNIKNSGVLTIFTWGILGLFIVLAFLTINKNCSSKIKGILEGFFKGESRMKGIFEITSQIIGRIGETKKTVVYIVALSLIIQFLCIGIIFLLSKSLSLNIAFSVLIVIVPIIFVVSMFPSVNGLGIREGAYVYFLGDMVGRGNAFALSLLFLSVTLLLSLMGGLVYVWVNRNDYFKKISLYKATYIK
jgi:glycosyltransferase 2 family protein